MSLAVARGLAQLKMILPTRMGVEETSFQKRHEYVTVVTNMDNSRVCAVMDACSQESLGLFLAAMDELRRSAIRVPAMEMWPPYMNPVKQYWLNAKIPFD